jgi:DivIVA domain-containing protein
VELDRRSIERRDFATARRGYDQAAVDAHLREVADAVEELKGTRAGAAPVSSSAAAKVQAVIAAAEHSAAELERAAREEAERITSQARGAGEDQLGRTRSASARLVERVEEIERELDALGEGLRSSLSALGDTVRGNVEAIDLELRSLSSELATPRPARLAGEPSKLESAPAAVEPVIEAPAVEKEPPPTAPAAPEGARLLALKMALDGAPREDTARYLRENFKVPDPDALLDEVYDKAGR